MIRGLLREQKEKLSPEELEHLYKNLSWIREWFRGDWMTKDEAPPELVRYFRLLSLLTPQQPNLTLYRVMSIVKEQDCDKYEGLANVEMQTSNKKLQSWSHTLEGAKHFYHMVRKQVPPPSERTDLSYDDYVYIIVEADVPDENILVDFDDVQAAMEILEENEPLDYIETGGTSVDDVVMNLERYPGQKEVIVYLPQKGTKVSRVHLMWCTEDGTEHGEDVDAA